LLGDAPGQFRPNIDQAFVAYLSNSSINSYCHNAFGSIAKFCSVVSQLNALRRLNSFYLEVASNCVVLAQQLKLANAFNSTLLTFSANLIEHKLSWKLEAWGLQQTIASVLLFPPKQF